MMMVIILVSVASYCASTIRLAHDTPGPGTPCGSTRDCGVFQSCVNRTTMLAVGACADRCGVCIHDGCWTVDRFRVYTHIIYHHRSHRPAIASHRHARHHHTCT